MTDDPARGWPHWRSSLFDARRVPFSCAGSFLAISWIPDDRAFWIRSLRGGDENTDFGRLLKVDADGSDLDCQYLLTPDCLLFGDKAGRCIRFSFAGPDRLCIESRGLGLRLEARAGKYNYVQATEDGVQLCIARQDMQCRIQSHSGNVSFSAPWNGLTSDNIEVNIFANADITLDVVRVISPDQLAEVATPGPLSMAENFQRFASALPGVPDAYEPGRMLAAYILWSAGVPPGGALSRPVIYMSKNWMTNLWSWDNCFVALALGRHAPGAAFDQMAAIYDHQHASGRLPDYLNDRFSYWSFTKPPIHGWSFARLRAMAPAFYDADRLRQVSRWLQKQAESWLAGPRLGRLPAYRHGNDAGWDNATLFLAGGPVATPDLATFLVLQFEEIAGIHTLLGEAAKADAAHAMAQSILNEMLTVLWDGKRFAARLAADGKPVEGGDSLLSFIPLLLGERLPEKIRHALLADLMENGRFLTAHGLATEAVSSLHYRADGYWRGPVWAPSTYLFVEALRGCGEETLARDIARRFCTMAQQSGMAENFDAITGEGQCDPAFAWTSAVYLLLAEMLSHRPEQARAISP